MKLIDLKPGAYAYVLTRDVANPQSDRRQRHDWRALPVWPVGMRFISRTEPEFAGFIALHHEGEYAHHEISSAHPAFFALIDAMEPGTDLDLHTLFRLEYYGNLWSPVLDELIRAGKVTASDCLEALRAHVARPE